MKYPLKPENKLDTVISLSKPQFYRKGMQNCYLINDMIKIKLYGRQINEYEFENIGTVKSWIKRMADQ